MEGEEGRGADERVLHPLFGLELDRALMSLAQRYGIRSEDFPPEVDFHTQCLLATLSFHTEPTDFRVYSSKAKEMWEEAWISLDRKVQDRCTERLVLAMAMSEKREKDILEEEMEKKKKQDEKEEQQ